MPQENVLCEAIRGRRLLGFQYHGRARVVAPYCYGVSRRGAEVLRAIQVRGDSASGGMGFGKLWMVSEMLGLTLLEESFTPNDPNYNPQDSAMSRIYCSIQGAW